ncbi:hypothetical protein EKO23_16645, partial [Nocardioides guangzhouensis]
LSVEVPGLVGRSGGTRKMGYLGPQFGAPRGARVGTWAGWGDGRGRMGGWRSPSHSSCWPSWCSRSRRSRGGSSCPSRWS